MEPAQKSEDSSCTIIIMGRRCHKGTSERDFVHSSLNVPITSLFRHLNYTSPWLPSTYLGTYVGKCLIIHDVISVDTWVKYSNSRCTQEVWVKSFLGLDPILRSLRFLYRFLYILHFRVVLLLAREKKQITQTESKIDKTTWKKTIKGALITILGVLIYYQLLDDVFDVLFGKKF